MDETVFKEVAELAREGAGLLIPQSRSYLVESRLAPILRREGLAETGDLIAVLKARPSSKLHTEAVAALTSKQTGFFRERDMLERITEHMLPMMADAADDEPLRVWCAGGAGGHEAYSLAILIAESEALVERRPDYVLILPWNIADEVQGQLSALADKGTRFVTAVPEIRVR